MPKKIPTAFRCPDCGANVDARLIGSDAEEREPRIMFKSLPAMICPQCDSSPHPASRKIHAALTEPPAPA